MGPDKKFDDFRIANSVMDEGPNILKEYSMVDHPSHYNFGSIECIDALEAATDGLTGIEAFCTANAIKYLWRWKHKNGVEDLEKAIWYINHLISRLTGSQN